LPLPSTTGAAVCCVSEHSDRIGEQEQKHPRSL
jgi:hypothetical protein